MAFAALTIDLNAHLAKFETDMARAGKSLDSLNSRASAAAVGLKSAFGALGVGIGVGALAAFAKSGIDAADSLNDMSARLGVSVKDLASFKLAADQSGTSLESVGEGVSRLSKSIGLAEAGNKQLAGALQGLGITARDPKEAFFQLADAVQRIDDPSKRAALLSQVLGKSYGELVPLLSQGSDALRQSARQSETFAEAMSRLAPNADKFNDQLAAMKINAAGTAGAVLVDLMPVLKGLLGVTLGVSEAFQEVGTSMGATAAAVSHPAQAFTIMKQLFSDLENRQEAFKKRFAEIMAPVVPGIGLATAGGDNADQLACIKDGGTWDGTRCIKKPAAAKADPQGLFVSKLRDEAANLGMGAEALQRYEALKLKLTGTNARLADGFITQIAAFKDQQAAAEANNALADDEIKKRKAIEDAQNNSIKSLREWIAEQEFEATLYGKTNAERETAIQLRAVESTGVDMQTEAFRKMHDQLVAISETHALDSLISDTTIEKTRTLHENIAILDRALLDGKISTEQWNEAFDKFNGGKKIQELDTFAKTAAENIQNGFSDFFKNFDKGTEGMGQRFGDMLKGMIADAVAADLTKKLFGGLADNGKTSGDGWAGAALKLIGGIFGGARADGGPVSSGSTYLVGERGPELFRPSTSGSIIPNGAMAAAGGGGHTVIININGVNNAADVRNAGGQVGRNVLGMITGAQRYA